MLERYALDIDAMLDYAKRWAFLRNPDFYTFDEIGGDCTNFVSQCVYAGGAVMNYTPDLGWYYISLYDRAAAWTGVEFFYNFMVSNTGAGPFGEEVSAREIRVGDIAQLGTEDMFYHSLLITAVRDGIPFVTAHTNDVYDRPLWSYDFRRCRYIHLLGARRYSSE